MKTLLVVLLSVALLSGVEVAGQSTRGSLQGVWQTVEVTLTGPGARTITIPEPRPNLMIVTARHYSRVEVQAEGPRPIPADLTKASADELRAVWGPFVGEAGTYEVTGNVMTMRPIAAKNPATNPLDILQRAVDNAKPRLEVKARRVGGATYQVPLEVPTDRQFALALRWLVDFADGRKGVPMKDALAAEILDAYQGQGNAIRKRDEVHKMAQANKAFAHFRW